VGHWKKKKNSEVLYKYSVVYQINFQIFKKNHLTSCPDFPFSFLNSQYSDIHTATNTNQTTERYSPSIELDKNGHRYLLVVDDKIV